MTSLTETTKRSKKMNRLEPVRVMRSKHYEAFDVISKLERIHALIPLGLMHIQELLEDEVRTLAGVRNERKASRLPGRRHGSNPGSVQLAGNHIRSRSLTSSTWLGANSPYRASPTSAVRAS